MSEAAAPEPGLTAKWYTRARKFPELVGKTPDGKRLPGGPYTLTQVIGGFAFGYLLYKAAGIWAHAGAIWNIAIWFGATYGFVWLLGRIPPGARNPVSLVAGVIRSVTSPSVGRIGGRRVVLKRPYQLRHRVLVATPIAASSSTSAADPTPVVTPPAHAAARITQSSDPTPLPPGPAVPAARPALSGVQRLLAGVSTPGSPQGSTQDYEDGGTRR